MATATINYGTEVSLSGAANLNSLANLEAKSICKIDNSSTLALTQFVELDVTLPGSSVSGTGALEIYYIESPDDAASSYTDGIDPLGTANVASSIKNARLIAVVTANANSQVVRWRGRLSDFGVSLSAPYGGLVVFNKTGTALNASGNSANYRPIKYDVA